MGPDRTERVDRFPQPPALLSAAAGKVPPPDEAAHLDSRLMAELSTLNYLVGQHVVKFYEADAGQITPTSIADDLALAGSLTAAAAALRARAERRKLETEIATSAGEAAMQETCLFGNAYAYIAEGCPLEPIVRAPDLVEIVCGSPPEQPFVFMVAREALRVLMELGPRALEELDMALADFDPDADGC
jgi:hypothetical protein